MRNIRAEYIGWVARREDRKTITLQRNERVRRVYKDTGVVIVEYPDRKWVALNDRMAHEAAKSWR